MWIWRRKYEELIDELENLREENEELYEKIYYLKEKIAKSGNAYYMKDASIYTKHYNELCRQKAVIEAKVTKLELENTYLKKLFDNIKPEKVSDYYRGEDGKFQNADGKSKLDQQKFIYNCLTAGMSLKDISEDTGLKLETVKLYIAQYEKYLSEQSVLVANLSPEGYGEYKDVPMSEIKNGVWIKDENFKIVNDK